MSSSEENLRIAKQFIMCEIANWESMKNNKMDSDQLDEVDKMVVGFKNVLDQLKLVAPAVVLNFPPEVK
jgi:hypothetical protein